MELEGRPGGLPARRRTRMERRYRRLLTLYPKAHRREHAEEMIGVLFAAADYDARVRAPKPVAWALRSGQHVADCADLVAGAARIRGRMLVSRVKQATRSSWMVRDPRWSDALAVISVIAPVLLLVAALAEFHLPQAVASSLTGHPHWRLTAALGLGDLPLAAGAPAVAALALLRLRRLAGLCALAAAIGQVVAAVQRPDSPFTGSASPVVAFTVLLACTAAAALLLSPGPGRGLALLTRGGAALIGAGALVLGGFSVGGNVWLDSRSRFTKGLGSEVTGLPGDLLIAAVLVAAAAGCLRAPVSRRVLALLAIPVIPYAIWWQEKLASDLFGQDAGASASIPSSLPLLYLPPLLLAGVIVAGTWLARRRAIRQGRPASAAGPRSAVSA
ncbi:MAG TPA: hypothetical protein VFV73_28395 [Streptosporangiaceae bacterium]|nr:hypothetical protein [Streptosporangiaceae bacterium]